MQDVLEFKDRAVFIAGGSSGINLGIADAFALRGAKVAVMSRSQDRVEPAAAHLGRHGGIACGFVGDVRDPAAVAAALEAAHARLGDFDVLVSGAAGNFVSPALDMSTNAFKTVVDIDLLGTFNVLRQAHRFLRKPGASVINISAPQSFNPTIFQAHACAAKAGVDMLTRVLAIEWGGDGVRINSIVPGPIGDTEGIRRLAPTEETRRAMEEAIPLGRMGTRKEVADMAMVLSSALASFVTGAVIPVDGGSSLLGGRDYRETYKAIVAARTAARTGAEHGA